MRRYNTSISKVGVIISQHKHINQIRNIIPLWTVLVLTDISGSAENA